MNLNAVAEYVVDQYQALLKGKNLFIDEMPASVTNGVLLLGPYHGARINHELRGLVNTEFTVIVRATDHAKGKQRADELVTVLTVDQETEVDGQILVKQMLPLNEPRPYRKSVAGYWEFEVDVKIVYVNL